MRFESFKCHRCNGSGGKGPIRKSTGLPFRECISCNGHGFIDREVWETEDRQEHMHKVAVTQAKRMGHELQPRRWRTWTWDLPARLSSPEKAEDPSIAMIRISKPAT